MSEQGILSMTAEQYRAAEGVSNSDLKFIAAPYTPLHMKAHLDGKMPREETPALRLGTVTHRAILERETMAGAFHIKPEDMSFATKEGKAWKASRAPGVPILTSDEAASIKGMADAVWSHPMASRILKSADFERSAFALEDGLVLKSRWDALPRGGNIIADLKTCESADLENVEKSIYQYAYFRQSAFYVRVAKLLGLERATMVFIFVEKSFPHAVACYQLADEVLRIGESLIERDLHVLRECMASGKWPGYGDGIMAAGIPEYALKRLENAA